MASAKFKHAVKRIKDKLGADYTPTEATPTAGPVGSGKLFIGGQVFNGDISGVTQVVNVGRPAAAQYAAKVGGGVTVSSSGGGSTTTGAGSSGAAITSSFVIADPDALLTNARLLAVSAALSLTDAGSGGNITIGMSTPPTLSVTSTSDAVTGSHAITASAAPGAAESLLKSTSAGNLALVSMTTPLVNTSSGNLSLQPASGTVALRNSGGTDRASLVVGNNTFDINPLPDSTADMSVRLFRSTNTSGTKTLALYAGDNTTNIIHQLSITGTTIFNAQGSAALDFNIRGDTSNSLFYVDASADAVGFNTSTPAYTVDVAGTMRATTSVITPVLTTVGAGVDLTLSPIDDIVLDPGSNLIKLTSGNTLQSDNYASQTTGMRITHDGQADFRYLFVDEMHAKSFIADLEQALAGGQIIAKSVTILYLDFTAPAASGSTTLTVRDLPSATGMACFQNSDYVRLRKFSRSGGSLDISDCWGTVVLDTSYGTSGFDSTTKTQRYTFTRSASPNAGAMTTGTVVEADAIVLDYGTSGNGFYEVNAIDGMYAVNSPYAQIVTWASHPRTQTVRARLGNLYGIFASSGEYGLYAGGGTADTDQYLRLSNSAVRLNNIPLRLHNGSTQTVNIDSAGTDIWVGPSSADKRLYWNGTTLAVKGAIEITSPSNFSGSGYLQVGSGTKDSTLSGWNMNSSEFVGQASGTDQVVMGTNGKITAGAGAVWLDAVGLNVAVVGVGTPTYIRFDNSTSTVGSIGYLRTTGPTPGANDGMIFNNAESTKFRFIGATSTEFSATVNVTGYVTATTGMSVGGTAVSLDDHTHSGYLPLSGGILAGTVTAQNITFATDNTYDIGAADKRVQDLYAVNLHVSTIVGEPAYSHHHAASDIDSGTLDFARIPTTWNGALTLDADTGLTSNYVRWTTQTSTLKAWDLIGRAHDYATTAQQNDLLLTYTDNVTTYIVWQADSGTRVVDFLNTPTVSGTAVSLSGHTHDDRYYTESEVTSLLSGYVPTSRTVSAGSGLTGGGALSGNITISHEDTSTQASVNNSGTTFIQDVTLDGFGHVTALGSVDIATALDALYVNVSGDTMTGTLTINAAAQLALQASGTDRASIVAGSSTLDVNPLPDGSADTNIRLFRLTNTSGSKNLLLLAGDNTATTVHQLSVTGTTIYNAQLSNIDFNIRGDTDTNLFYVDASADAVGFGTATPAYKVDATGSIRATVSMLTPTVTTTSGNLTLTSAGGTVAVTGAMTASSTGAFTSTLTAASDTDAINTFGRVRLGYAAATDTASFSHFDQNTSTNFALSQSAAGATIVNAASGQTVDIQVAGVSQWTASTVRLNPRSTVTLDIGDYNRKVRTLHAAELAVETLVAQNVMATVGGRIIVAPTVKLIADLANSGTATSFSTNLAAYWALDEASGNRSDSRGTQILTNTNTVASTTGKQSSAANFTGSSSEKLNRSDSSTLSAGDIDFFFSLWIYPTLNSGSRMTLINKGSSGSGEYRVEIDWATSTVRFLVANAALASTEVTSSVTISTNAWYFVTAWHDSVGNVIGVGVNGNEATTAHATGVRDSTGNFCLGARDTNQYYTGYMDEVGFWKSYIPSAHERRWLYNQYAGRTYTEINTQVQSTIDVDGNSFALGDFIYLSAAPGGVAQVESMRISSSASAITGGYRYTVVRNHDGSGINSWNTGDAVIDIGGAAGSGYIDLTSTSTIHSHLGPTLAVYQRSNIGVWNETVPTVALGNLRSFVDYASDAAGLAIGNDLTLTPATGFAGLTADATNGIRLFNTELKLYSGATEAVRVNSTVGLRFTTGAGAINTVSWYDSINGYDQGYIQGNLSGGTATLNLRAVAKDVGTGAFSGTADIILSNTVTSSSIKLLANDGSVNGPDLYMTVAHTGITINRLGLSIAPAVGTVGVSVTTPANQTLAGVSVQAANCGSSYGPFIAIYNNNNGSTPSAGWLRMYRRDGSTGDLWVDASGNLRIGVASAVTNATDTGGTVCGTQTSSLDTKNVIGEFTDNDLALSTILSTPLYNFTYKSGSFNGEQFTGVITDYAPTFGMDCDMDHPFGKSLNEINAHGYAMAAIKALNKKIESQQVEIQSLRGLIASMI